MHKKLPPYLAYILWNCSGVDVNNLESILVMTWHRQAVFQIQYGIFQVNSNEVKQDVLNHSDKQRVLMHGHQGWNVRHGLCHIYMIYVYIWVVYSFCWFCCLFIIVTTQFVALYKPCKPKPKSSTYDPPRTTTPWQRSKDRYLDRLPKYPLKFE